MKLRLTKHIAQYIPHYNDVHITINMFVQKIPPMLFSFLSIFQNSAANLLIKTAQKRHPTINLGKGYNVYTLPSLFPL